MWSAVISLLKWCLKYWKQILTWLGVAATATWAVMTAFDGLQTLSSWAFSHWAAIIDYFYNAMNEVYNELSDFAVVNTGFWAKFFDLLQIDFAVSKLVGFCGYAVVLFEWTITGIFVTLITYAVTLVYFKLKTKGISIAKNGN